MYTLAKVPAEAFLLTVPGLIITTPSTTYTSISVFDETKPLQNIVIQKVRLINPVFHLRIHLIQILVMPHELLLSLEIKDKNVFVEKYNSVIDHIIRHYLES